MASTRVQCKSPQLCGVGTHIQGSSAQVECDSKAVRKHGRRAATVSKPVLTSDVAPVHPDTDGGGSEERFQYLVAMEPDTDEAVLLRVFAPEKVAANAGRIYDHMRENGITADSATREAAFAYAASALGRPYDDFYDAWIEERAVDLD